MEPLATSQVQAYLFDPNSGQYTEKGLAGIAIVGTPGGPGTYRLGCYLGDEYLCTADISNNNETGIQWSIIGTGYASFRDDQARIWSVSFPGGDPEAFQFSASLVVAMYGASNQPEGSVICCDVAQGRRDRIIVPNDKVKVRYASWVVQRNEPISSQCPKLGSQLESNENDSDTAYVYAAPLNHNNVTADMKGFEGMTIGMAEESRRFIIVPKSARRGQAPNVHICYMVYVVKKKDNAAAEVEAFRSMQQQSGGGGGGGDNKALAIKDGRSTPPPQQQGSNQPTVVVVHSNAPDAASRALVPADQQQQSAPAATAPAPAPAPAAPAMPAPAPGFNFEQMDVVNRMRDQVANLLMQIKETTSRVDLFSHDMRQGIEKAKPKSLATAQMQHTLDSMLHETESLKETLSERDKTLRQLEDKNKDLQGKVDAFTATAGRLSEERKAAMAETSQVKLDGDQKALSLQSELTRIMSEREDTSRHLSSVKRLLDISSADAKKEQQSLQTAEVQITTIEAKTSSTDENLIEERGRRKLLEGKIASLGDELRSMLEEIRVKESQIDERRRKMEADKLHYSQIMDEERDRAAEEIRELRDELVQEITVRDRRYQEERARVARESFERGRVQGIEDGHNEAAMEVDARMQMLTLEAQRHRSEVETIKVRLHQSHETAEASRRHQEAHVGALGKVVDELQGQVHSLEVELRALDSTRVTAQDAAAESIVTAVQRLTRPVSRSDLLGMMHALRTRGPVDTGFESVHERDERSRAAAEHDAVVAWVKRRAVAPVGPETPQEAPPPLITPWVEDVVPPELQPGAQASAQAGANAPAGLQPNFLEGGLNSPISPHGAPMRPDYVADVEARQAELLAALHRNDPTLELIPPKPPTPEPPVKEPTPEPPTSSADEAAAEAEAAPGVSTKAADATDATDATDSDDEEYAKLAAQQQQLQQSARASAADPLPEPQPQPPADEGTESDVDDDDGYGQDPMANAYVDPAANIDKQQPEADDDDDDDEHEAEQDNAAAATAAVAAEEEEEEAQDEEYYYEEEEEDEPAAAAASASNKKASSAVPASRQAALFAGDDSDDDEPAARPAAGKQKPAAKAPVAKTATVAQRSTTAAKPTVKMFSAGSSGDDDDDSEDEKPVFRAAQSAKQQTAPPASKPAAKKSLFAETDSDDDSDAGYRPPAKKATVAPTTTAAVKRPPAPKKSLFAASDSDD